MLRILAAVTVAAMMAQPALSKDPKNKSLEDAVLDEVRDAIFDDDDHDRGQGRPDNPGEHGRDNAAQKQRENQGHGKGGSKNDSLEKRILDEFEDSDERDKNGKKKKKNA